DIPGRFPIWVLSGGRDGSPQPFPSCSVLRDYVFDKPNFPRRMKALFGRVAQWIEQRLAEFTLARVDSDKPLVAGSNPAALTAFLPSSASLPLAAAAFATARAKY